MKTDIRWLLVLTASYIVLLALCATVFGHGYESYGYRHGRYNHYYRPPCHDYYYSPPRHYDHYDRWPYNHYHDYWRHNFNYSPRYGWHYDYQF